ncbi:MAG: hypothetical protein IKZ88_01885 [Neisseriaceae bacterium]|nr:hypothetical protein [Neisseriaceae bacterium]
MAIQLKPQVLTQRRKALQRRFLIDLRLLEIISALSFEMIGYPESIFKFALRLI